MAEREAKKTTGFIRNSIFRVSNMIGVKFLNSKGKSAAITYPDHRPDDITYFTFRTTVNSHLVDTREPDSVYLFEFSLRLPNTCPPYQHFVSSEILFNPILHLPLSTLSTLPWVN